MTRRKVSKNDGDRNEPNKNNSPNNGKESSKLKFRQLGLTPANFEFLDEAAEEYELAPNVILNRWLDYMRSLPKGERTLYLFPKIAEQIRQELEHRDNNRD